MSTNIITINPMDSPYSNLSVYTKLKQFNNFTTSQIVIYEAIKYLNPGNNKELHINETRNYFVKLIQDKENVYLNKAIKTIFDSNEQYKNKLSETYIEETDKNTSTYSQYNKLLIQFKYNNNLAQINNDKEKIQNIILPLFISYQQKFNIDDLNETEKNILTERLIKLYMNKSLPDKLLNIIEERSIYILPNELQINYQPVNGLNINGVNYKSIFEYVRNQMEKEYSQISNIICSSIISIIKSRLYKDQTFLNNLLKTENSTLMSYTPTDILEIINIDILNRFRKLLKERSHQQSNKDSHVKLCSNIMFVLSGIKQYLDSKNITYVINNAFVNYLLNLLFKNINLSLYIIPDNVPENIKSIILSYRGFEHIDNNIIWKYVKLLSVMYTKYGIDDNSVDIVCDEKCISNSINNIAIILNNIKSYSENQKNLITQDNIKNGKVKMYTRNNCKYCTSAKTLLNSKNYSFKEVKVSDGDTVSVKLALKDKTNFYNYYPIIFVNEQFIGGFKELNDYVNIPLYKDSKMKINTKLLSREDFNFISSLFTNKQVKNATDLKQTIEYLKSNITNSSVKQRIYNYSLY